jgi:hypothetical protein
MVVDNSLLWFIDIILWFYALLSLYPLLCLAQIKASVWWNPAEEAGDPGESSRVSQRATIIRTKWHNTNLSPETVTLL